MQQAFPTSDDETPLSKRAARRLIQRAFVLAGRSREVRQHIRHLQLDTLWSVEERGLEWTVEIDRGHLNFDRRPAKNPALRITWRSAAGLFGEAGPGPLPDPTVEGPGEPAVLHALDILCRAFRRELNNLLQNPVDENGDPLV